MPDETNKNEIAASEQTPLEKTTEELPRGEDKNREKTGLEKFEEHFRSKGIPIKRMERTGIEIIFHPKPMKK